jgi:hypothetical protein
MIAIAAAINVVIDLALSLAEENISTNQFIIYYLCTGQKMVLLEFVWVDFSPFQLRNPERGANYGEDPQRSHGLCPSASLAVCSGHHRAVWHTGPDQSLLAWISTDRDWANIPEDYPLLWAFNENILKALSWPLAFFGA